MARCRPLDDPGIKIFTIGIIIAGCSSGIYVVTGLFAMVAEGEINKALGGRRMTKEIEKLSNHTIICGFGRVGQMLAHDLAKANQEFVIIDNSEERVSGARNAGYLVLKGSASDEETLEAAGIMRARVLATVLPDDTTNVFITLSARELNGTMEIIARAESPSTEKKLLRSGATRIVLPALIGATKIGQMILRPTADDLLQAATGTAYLNDELKSIGLEMMEISVQAKFADVRSSRSLTWKSAADSSSSQFVSPTATAFAIPSRKSNWPRETCSSFWGIRGLCHNSPAKLGHAPRSVFAAIPSNILDSRSFGPEAAPPTARLTEM